MSLKDKIENNIVIWLLSTLFAGFIAGIGTYGGILKISGRETISSSKLSTLRQRDPQAVSQTSNVALNRLVASRLEGDLRQTSGKKDDVDVYKSDVTERLERPLEEEQGKVAQVTGSKETGTGKPSKTAHAEAAAWNYVKNSSFPREYKTFLSTFPTSQYALVAKMKLEKLEEEIGALQELKARFKDNGDGTVTDTKLGLMWTKRDSWNGREECQDWNQSREYASQLNTAGYTDWRMPLVSEIKSLIHAKLNNKAGYQNSTIHIDSNFASGGAYWMWSSEKVGSYMARFVDLKVGHIDDYNRNNCFNYSGVRGVRWVRRGSNSNIGHKKLR